jgi:hypothetical protein
MNQTGYLIDPANDESRFTDVPGLINQEEEKSDAENKESHGTEGSSKFLFFVKMRCIATRWTSAICNEFILFVPYLLQELIFLSGPEDEDADDEAWVGECTMFSDPVYSIRTELRR